MVVTFAIIGFYKRKSVTLLKLFENELGTLRASYEKAFFVHGSECYLWDNVNTWSTVVRDS